ncbi:MAG: ABC transporter permease [Deltaproteobacteria bacterium]|nr:ABC transporter permease [Deltaproteobacteria bacterium]
MPSGFSSFSLYYALTDALGNLRDNLVTSLLSALTVAFSLAIFTVFLVVFVNLNNIAATWGERTHVVAYVKEGIKTGPSGTAGWPSGTAGGPPGAANWTEALKKTVEATPGVKDVTFISKEGALAALRAELKGHEGVLEGVAPDILPASFEIILDPSYVNPDGVRSVVERLRAIDGIFAVEYGAEWVERFSSFMRFMEIFTFVIGAFLAAATLFIISNTIRLTVYARRHEIEVMRYLGASGAFIKVPFLVEGMASGVMGGALSLGILFLGRYAAGRHIPQYFIFIIENPFPLWKLSGGLMMAGLLLGGAGSLVSLGRFLKV